MIAWLVLKTGMQAWLVKLILLAVATGAILFALRLWGNEQWRKGEQQGRQAGMEFMEKKKNLEWAEKEKAQKVKDAELLKDRKTLASDSVANAKTLRDGLALIRSEMNRDRTIAITIPAHELPTAVLSRSRNLADSPKPVY